MVDGSSEMTKAPKVSKIVSREEFKSYLDGKNEIKRTLRFF